MIVAEFSNGKLLYRNMTDEEISEMECIKAGMPDLKPSQEERLDALETTTDDLVLMMADLIGGN